MLQAGHSSAQSRLPHPNRQINLRPSGVAHVEARPPEGPTRVLPRCRGEGPRATVTGAMESTCWVVHLQKRGRTRGDREQGILRRPSPRVRDRGLACGPTKVGRFWDPPLAVAQKATRCEALLRMEGPADAIPALRIAAIIGMGRVRKSDEETPNP